MAVVTLAGDTFKLIFDKILFYFDLLNRVPEVSNDPYGPETEIYRYNEVNTIPADVLAKQRCLLCRVNGALSSIMKDFSYLCRHIFRIYTYTQQM